jgi:hypothetical protein
MITAMEPTRMFGRKIQKLVFLRLTSSMDTIYPGGSSRPRLSSVSASASPQDTRLETTNVTRIFLALIILHSAQGACKVQNMAPRKPCCFRLSPLSSPDSFSRSCSIYDLMIVERVWCQGSVVFDKGQAAVTVPYPSGTDLVQHLYTPCP